MNRETELITEAYNKMIITENASMREEFELDGKKIKFVVKRKVETDEWLVKVYIDGKYDEDATYYTDDKEDAINTMAHMKKTFHFPKTKK